MKEITFVLTAYNLSQREINNFNNSINEINRIYKETYGLNHIDNPIDFLILSDNPEIPLFNEENFIKLEKNNKNVKYIPCDKNRVRLGQVFKHIENIKSRYVKTIDPDDYLIPDFTVKFIESFLKDFQDNESIIIHSYNVVRDFDIYHETLEFVGNKIYFKNKSFNPNSIYPLSILKKIKWDWKILIWSDDLIGFLLYLNGAKLASARDYGFYLNLSHGGVSTTEDFHRSMRFINDSILFLEIVLDFIKGDEFKTNMLISLTAKPSFWFIDQIRKDLYLNESIGRIKKLFLINKVLKLSKKIYDKEKNFFWFRVATRFRIIFKIWK